MLTSNGLCRIDSNVDAMACINAAKNVKLFEEMGVLTAEECGAREQVMFGHYVGQVEIEAMCMVDMINQVRCRASE